MRYRNVPFYTASSLISKDEFHAIQSEQFVKDKFHDSLPAFIAAFTARKKPTAEELNEIKKLLDSLGEVSPVNMKLP